MSSHGDVASTPLEFELFDAFLNKANEFRVTLRATDGGDVILDFTAESEGFHRIVDALTQATTRSLSTLGSRGVVITGLTELTDEDSS